VSLIEGLVPWPEAYVSLYKKKGYWEDRTLGEHLALWVSKYADRPALAFQGREISYRQMDACATRLAYHMVRQLGMEPCDRVVLQLPNVPDLVYVLYACMKFGAIPICTLPTHRWSEISFLSNEAEAKAHVVPAGKVKDFDYEEFAEKVRQAAPSLEHVLTMGKPERPGMISIDDLTASDVHLDVAEKELSKHRPDPMQPALFQLSGGTTGVPKIIPRTHNDYAYNALCSAKALEYTEETRLLIPVPLTHNLSLVNGLLAVHSKGGTVVLCDSSAPLSILRAIHENRAESALLVNVLMHRLLELPSEERSRFNTGSLKRVAGGWSSDDPEIPRFLDMFHCDGVKTYGMTEGLVCWTRWPDPPELRLHSDGRPISEADELKLVDPETGAEVPVGHIGEMWCRGPYTIRGYYKAPERNQEAFTPDGYYRTGDLMKIDAERNVFWAGRIKDCIDRGGEKINAEEVEAHILSFPKVKRAAVVGMPDKAMGERICAFIVPTDEEAFTFDELCDFLLNEQKIASYKLPERVEFLNDLPVTKVGKYDKKSLREKIAEKLKSEGGA
jgi:2,3-dihydroxybenzoate-AMP ligase